MTIPARCSFPLCSLGLIVACLLGAAEDAAAKTFVHPLVPVEFEYPDDWREIRVPGIDSERHRYISSPFDEGGFCGAFAVPHFGDESWPALDDMPAFRNERLSDFKENPAAILKALDADVDTATAAIVQINGLPWLRLDYETDGSGKDEQGATIMTVRGAYEISVGCTSSLRKHLDVFNAIIESVRTTTPD